MNRILIMVLSYMEPPYDTLLKTQRETWDSVEVDGVRTVFYYGGGKGWVNEKEFSADASDEYFRMGHKCVEALKNIEIYSYDIIFRCNSSAYINKQLLKKFSETLPKEKLYGGWEIDGNDGYNVVSGSGIFWSTDVAKTVIDKTDINREREEDVLFAELLFKEGIKILDDKSRYDVPEIIPYNIPLDRYSYRLKTSNRLLDAANMKKLHKKLIF